MDLATDPSALVVDLATDPIRIYTIQERVIKTTLLLIKLSALQAHLVDNGSLWLFVRDATFAGAFHVFDVLEQCSSSCFQGRCLPVLFPLC